MNFQTPVPIGYYDHRSGPFTKIDYMKSLVLGYAHYGQLAATVAQNVRQG